MWSYGVDSLMVYQAEVDTGEFISNYSGYKICFILQSPLVLHMDGPTWLRTITQCHSSTLFTF